MTSVFLSHATADLSWMEEHVVPVLRQRGFQEWYAEKHIRAADAFPQSIREAIDNCDVFLVIVTPRSVESTWVRCEVHHALDHDKTVYPLLVEDADVASLDFRLGPVQRIDFRLDISGGQERLRSALIDLERASIRTVCVASDEPDANWDQFAAREYCNWLDPHRRMLPIFRKHQLTDFDSLWLQAGTPPFHLIVFGSPRRFQFTQIVLDRLRDNTLGPADIKFRDPQPPDYREFLEFIESPGNVEILKPSRVAHDAAWNGYAAILAARNVNVQDTKGADHSISSIVLVMGLSGPATLAASWAYFHHPQEFEPPSDHEPATSIAQASLLQVEFRRRDASEFPDNRCVDANSARILRRATFGESTEIATDRGAEHPPLGNPVLHLAKGFQRSLLWRVTDRPVAGEHAYQVGQWWPFVWGWKRDTKSGHKSRLIYTSGTLFYDGEHLWLADFYLYLYSQCSAREVAQLRSQFLRVKQNGVRGCHVDVGDEANCALLEVGRPTLRDEKLIRGLRRRRRERVAVPERPNPAEPRAELFRSHLPCDLYVGSGLSYESGVPRLAELHEAFGVDNRETNEFVLGADDPLPASLSEDFQGAVKRLLQVEIKYIQAAPSGSHWLIRQLCDSQIVGRVFTDNVDDIMERTGVSVVRTRGPGIFNERYNVIDPDHGCGLTPESKSLWVVGVSADRREVIRQARREGKRILVVNPLDPVSPLSKNVDYLDPEEDVFIQARFADVHDAVRAAAGISGGQAS